MRSWISPGAEKKTSGIEGRGLFAREPIAANEIVAVKGGVILDRDGYLAIRDEITPAEIQIENDLFIGPSSIEGVEENMLHLNHSCEPNVGVRGQVTFVTMRPVHAGEELTIDYAMIDGDSDMVMECSCGTSKCRGRVTGDDWRIPEIAERYRGHFSRYLEEPIVRRVKLEE